MSKDEFTNAISLGSPRAKEFLVFAAVCLVLGSLPVRAQVTATWTGSSGGSWSTPSNWGGDTAPGSTTGTTDADTAIFNTGATVNVDSGRNLLNIDFGGATTSTLQGGSLLLSGGGTIASLGDSANANRAGFNPVINTPITLEGTATFTDTTGLTLMEFGASASITDAIATTLTLAGSNSSTTHGNGAGYDDQSFDTIAGNITDGGGSLSVTMQGSNIWALSGTNSYSGATTVQAGTLEFVNRSSLYNANTAQWTGSRIIVQSGGTLALGYGGTGQFTAPDVASLLATASVNGGFENGSSLGLDVSYVASGTATYAGNITDLNGGANILGFTKLGGQTLVLSGNNSYTGETNVDYGTLNVGSANALGDGGAITFNNGILQYSAANAVDYSSRIVNSTDFIDIDTNGQTVTFASGLAASNVAGLLKTGSGTLVLTNVNAYSGTTVVSAGELDLDSLSGPAVPGDLEVNAGTLTFLSGNQLTSAAPLVLEGGIANIGATIQNAGTLELYGGSLTGTTGTFVASTFYEMVSGSSSANLAGTATFNKVGTGTVILSGTDS